MSAAVKEAPIVDVATWKMPDIKVGDSVVWFADADKTSPPHSAKVIDAGSRCLELRVEARDQSFKKYSVRHVNDPALAGNDSLRAFGGWDYTFQHKELLRRIRALEDRSAMGSK